MRHALVAGVLGLVLSGGAHAATGGSVTGTVVATPLAVALSLSSSSQPAGASLTATATVSNLGAGALSNVDVTLQADSNIAGASTKRLASLAGGGNGNRVIS